MQANPVMRALRCGLLVLVVTQPAFAQINEADRLARCRNNRAALAQLEATRESYATEEQIARARSALISIRRLEAQFEWNRAEADLLYPYIRAYQGLLSGDALLTKQNYETKFAEMHEDNVKILERIRQAGISVNFVCRYEDAACLRDMPQRLAQGIDAAVAQQPQRQQFLQQVQTYRSSLIALRCDQPGRPNIGSSTEPVSAIPDMAGSWRGGNGGGSIYSFRQNGVSVNWTRSDNDEIGTATVTRNSIGASYSSSYGTGSSVGTIEFDATGRAVRIRWNNGDSYVRQ